MVTEVLTFGCRLNAFESEVIRGHATAAGLDDAVIVNTCAVTKEAERQARQAIRRARRDHPQARLIVTGCAAQIDPARYAAMPEVDLVLGNDEKMKAESYSSSRAEGARIKVGDIMALTETAAHLVDGFEGRARAFIEVQQGCDHRCTFCIIPYGRGNSRSVPIGEIVRQAERLTQAGYRELVLTGVDITGFGGDLPGQPDLGQLCRRLLALVPGLERLRLSSLDPVEIDDALWRLIGDEKRLMPHLHLSVQAGDDMILKRMKRRHLRADALAAFHRARALRPDIALGADMIAGFPTEDEEMFARSVAFVEEAALDYLHVFPFSSRPGTPAARMPQVPGNIVKERAAKLRAAGAASMSRALTTRIGTIAQVLVERTFDEGGGFGHSEHYAPVRFTGAAAIGSVALVRVTEAKQDCLAGAIA